MDLLEYVCVWAGLLLLRMVELFVLQWIATRMVLAIAIVLLYESIRGGETAWKWTIQFLCHLEETVDEIFELAHWFDRPPDIGVRTHSGWEMVAATRPSNSGYGAKQFKPVIICDRRSLPDDPFTPDHVSTVNIIEIRRRSHLRFWVFVWQVSLLNGGQRRLSRLDIKYSKRPWWFNIDKCFKSAGVIFILLDRWVFISDGRYERWQLYEYSGFGWKVRVRRRNRFPNVVSMTCEGRIWRRRSEANEEKVLDGWVIRVIVADICKVLPLSSWRMSLTCAVFEVSLDGRVKEISRQDVIFDRLFRNRQTRPIRTSRGFGIYYENTQAGDGPSMLFDETTNRFVYLANFQQLLAFDGPFDDYFNTPPPNEDIYLADGLCPVFLNDREFIECARDGTVFRYETEASTLKYTMTKAMFRARPTLRIEMDADEFQSQTGIGGMQAHFCDRQRDDSRRR